MRIAELTRNQARAATDNARGQASQSESNEWSQCILSCYESNQKEEDFDAPQTELEVQDSAVQAPQYRYSELLLD